MLQISHGSTTTNDVYGKERLFAEQNGVRSWYANDALGSVRVTLDDTGVPSEPASYDPWGKGGSATFGFTGEFQDTTDLVYLRARWYDPRSATFISRDPFEGYAEQPYSTHPYQYGYANPVVNTDPSGQAVQLPPMDGGCPAGSFWDAALARCVSPASSPERRYDDPFKAMLGDHEPCGPPNIMIVTQVYDDPAHPGSVSYKTECLPAGFVPEPPSGKTIIQGWTIDPYTGIAKPFCAVKDDDEDNSNPASDLSNPLKKIGKGLDKLKDLLKRGLLVHDEQYTIDRHTLVGKNVIRDLRRGKEAHVFNEDIDLNLLAQKVWNEGIYQGKLDKLRDPVEWERITWTSPSPIGRRIQNGKPDTPLYVVEVKVRQYPDGIWRYHLDPRSRPAK